MEQKDLLETILCAQVLILANQIEAEYKAKGSTRIGDYLPDVAKLIYDKKPRILEVLRERARW